MATKALIFAAALIAGLSGCAAQLTPSTPPPVDCDNSGACKVVVQVDGCPVRAPDVNVFSATNIFWELDQQARDNGWSFPDTLAAPAIWIKDPPQGQFDSPDRQSEWRYKLHDKNNVKGTFRYGVRVVKGSILCELDPTIVNH